MSKDMMRALASYSAIDDEPLYVIRKDLSGGVNSRMHGSSISENQATILYNADLSTPGQVSKRRGSVQIADDVSNNSVNHLHNYIRQGYTDDLLMIESNDIYANEEEAASWTWVTSATASADVWGSVQCKESGLVPDDVVIVQNGTDNPLRLHKDSAGTWAIQDLGATTGASGSPTKSNVMCWYGNRVWVLKNDLLYFSDAYDADYSTAFDTVTNIFRIPVGQERGLAPTRDTGIVILGQNAIWGLAPSSTPVATDKPQPLITDSGVVSKHGWAIVGDDIHYFSTDGHRSLKRTIQDKLQLGGSPYPLSYFLKDEFERITFAYIDRIRMKFFDNKLFIVVPTGAASFDTWVYYPASNSYMVIQGWSPRCFETHKISGAERFYYGKHGNGVVYRGWHGFTDEGTTTTNGTAINFQEEGRKEDLGQPLVKKNGGELNIKAKASGDYDISVSIQFDDGGYNTLGTLNLAGNLITFPVTFPVIFLPPNICYEKFHLDNYGEWYQAQIKLQHNATNSDDEITILERDLLGYPIEYISEEEA